MALKFGFFNSLNGDRKYNAEDVGRYLNGLVTDGVYMDKSDSLQVLAYRGLTVAVQPGRAMFDFHYLENDAVLYLTVESGGSLARYDAVIAKLDYNNRLISVYVKPGTPASTPVKPTVERSETVKEYCLAYIYVDKLAATITQADITDMRANRDVCGWVTGVIQQVDSDTLFVQYEEAAAQFFAGLNKQVENLQNVIDGVLGTSEMMLKARYDSDNDGVVTSAVNAKLLNGFWIDFTDESGNPTDEPYIHWLVDAETGEPITTQAIESNVTVMADGIAAVDDGAGNVSVIQQEG